MRIARAHQQPYNGFAWDHPLRERWRAVGGEDPCTSSHPWYYLLRDPFLNGLMVLLSVFIGSFYLLTQGNVVQYRIAYATVIGVVWALCITTIISFGFEFCKENSRRFNETTRELAHDLKIPHESLPSYSQHELERLARLSLILEARSVLEAEQESAACPISTESSRARAKRSFEKTYEFLRATKLINDCGYGPFFQKAKEELDRAV